jgi:alanine racemase
LRHGFIPSVSELEEAEAYDRAAASAGRKAAIHFIVDTGMGRIGVWEDDAATLLRQMGALPNLEISGIASHLPVADEDEKFTREQLQRFWALIADFRRLGLPVGAVHIDNSAGAMVFPKDAGNFIRAGLALYGSSPVPSFQPQLRPVLTWKAAVTLVRDVGAGRGISYGRTFITPHPMRIATLAVGYADGFQRHLSGKGAEVLIHGRRCMVLGRVTMDQILVDVTAVPEARAGDDAVLLGAEGGIEILAQEMATKAGTIPWDIFTGIGNRVQRVLV